MVNFSGTIASAFLVTGDDFVIFDFFLCCEMGLLHLADALFFSQRSLALNRVVNR